MPGWLTEVLKLLGFTTPFVYAAATYGVFHWLDKKASGAAKRALTARLQSQPPDKETLANYALEVFDRIYSKPLWHVRAFCRSALITTVLCAVIWIEVGFLESESDFWRGSGLFIIGSSFVVNVFADYMSLFLIKRLLTASGRSPAFGLIASFLVGCSIVYIAYILRASVFLLFKFGRFLELIEFLFAPNMSVVVRTFISSWELSAPAVAVHLWLPLLALSIVLTQASRWLFKAVGWMQWFIKQGQHHPFEAVGYVASAIVFVSSVVIQYAWR